MGYLFVCDILTLNKIFSLGILIQLPPFHTHRHFSLVVFNESSNVQMYGLLLRWIGLVCLMVVNVIYVTLYTVLVEALITLMCYKFGL